MADKKKGGAPQTQKSAPQQKDSARGPRRDNNNRGQNNNAQAEHSNRGRGEQHGNKPPFKVQYEKDMDAHNQTIDKLKAEIDSKKTKIDEASAVKNTLYQQKNKLVEELKKVKEAKKQAKDNKKKYFDEIKALSEQKQRMREELQKLKDKIPQKLRGNEKEFDLKTVHDKIDLKIGELENKLKLTSMPLSEEKALVSEISSLHNLKKLAREYDIEMQKIKGTLDSNNKPAQDKKEKLSGLIQQEDKTITEMAARQDELQKQLDALRDKITKATDSLPNLIKDRDALRDKVKEEQAAKQELFKKKQEQQAEYDVYMEEVRKQRKEEKKALDAQRAVEREKRRMDALQQQLGAVQFEEELHTCDVLVAHLQQFLIKPEDEEAAAEQQNAAPAANTPEGAVVLKRDVSEEVAAAYQGGKGKGKGKKPKAPVLKADTVLKHSLTLLQQFESLSLACPLKVADVPKSIEEIKQKKEHFIVLGVEKKKQLEAEWAQKQKEAEAKAETEANTTTTTDAAEDATPEAQS